MNEEAMANFITLNRIYDVLMCLLTEQNASVATDLLELHARGMLLGSTPAFTGSFVTNDLNGETFDTDEDTTEN